MSNLPWFRHDRGSPDFVSEFNRAVNRMFGDFFERPGSWPTASAGTRSFGQPALDFVPRVDVKDSGRTLQIKAELPGMDEKDIEVALDGEALTISGEKKYEKEDKHEGRSYYESSYGRFSRTIPLPYEVDREKVDAQFKKGVLTVSLERSEEAKKNTRKIAIKS